MKYSVKHIKIMMLIVVCMFGRLGIGMWGYYTYHNIMENPGEEYILLSDWLTSNIDESETLYSPLGTAIYVYSERFPTTKYHALPDTESAKMQYMIEERNNDLVESPPDYILVDEMSNGDDYLISIINSEYVIKDNYLQYGLYKRKEEE